MRIQPFDQRQLQQADVIAATWNQACGADLAISPRFVAYNCRPATGSTRAGWLALENDTITGFILASALPNDAETSPPEVGWIDALAVEPAFQRRGIGAALLGRAEAWLSEQGCTTVRLGGGLRPYAPGLPVELASEAFFQARGYRPRASEATVWDVASDLAEYASDARTIVSSPGFSPRVAVGRPADAGVLLAFLRQEFPGRWRFEFEEFRRMGGKMSEYILLWRQDTGRAAYIDGFCRIRRRWRYGVEPLDRYFMQRLPPPWGQLGPIGIGADSRGQGLGAALLDSGLRKLRAYGVRGCVIDWTTALEFYARFGFKPLRAYRVLVKHL
ncbi:MAG: GNAT family N-acetyltransferase [Caldilineales bacterium]